MRFFVLLLLIAVIGWSPARRVRAEEDVGAEEPEFLPGLLVSASTQDGTAVERVAPTVAVVRARTREGERALPARWSGYLLSQNEGAYRLHAFFSGRLVIRLQGRTVLADERSDPGWVSAEPVELPFDWHAFEVDYEPSAAAAALSLYWSGPGFDLEPIGPRQLYHDPEATPPADVLRGAQLARSLRCDACHAAAGTEERAQPLSAPALDQLSGHVYREWLWNWLSASPSSEPTSAAEPLEEGAVHAPLDRRMPYFALGDEQRKLLVDYLAPADPADDKAAAADEKLRHEGQQLLLTRGCLACHSWQSIGTTGPFSGGDLTEIAAKRPKSYFHEWLAHPERLNVDHRMPVFSLTAREQQALAEFLASCGSAPPQRAAQELGDAQQEAAKQLLSDYRCTACHATSVATNNARGGDRKLSSVERLTAASQWERSCAARTSGHAAQPSYGLPVADQQALRAYYAQNAAASIEAPQQLALRLEELNCTGCHARYEHEGLTAKLPEVAAAHPELAASLSALAPPSLNSVGDKLRDEALDAALLRKDAPRRPWLEVQMPRYKLTDEQRRVLVTEFVAADRIPDGAPTTYQPRTADVPRHVADRLVTADGFGCTSCHAVGKVQPQKAVLNTLGPDLLMLERHIRRSWFERWVRNPARIVPRMEMPSVTTPVPGVLDSDLEHQLAAVWDALNQPDFRPPAPNPVRVVRSSGRAEDQQHARFVTDVTKVGEHTYTKPVIIGLPNRHNVLFDLETARLAHWWLGDAARERTLGKSWFWETGAEDLVRYGGSGPEITLRRAGGPLDPQPVGQFLTEFDELRHVPDGLEIRYRLNFGRVGMLPVVQRFEGSVGQDEIRRTLVMRNIPSGAQVELRLGFAEGAFALAMSGRRLSLVNGTASCEIAGPSDARFSPSGEMVLTPNRAGEVEVQLVYRSTIPAGVLPPVATPPVEMRQPETLDIIPGMNAVRLPLPADVMPTSLAWAADGALLVSSLKGQVLRAADANEDGWPDELRPVSEDLAAPYGLATGPDYIDVINKYALLRLKDEDGDGFCERTMTLASGWGHTADYHDWAVGLPRDADGNYYVGLPCQQDERSEAAARYRGTVLRLRPRMPTADDPRVFALETISTGHRFPMGLARNAVGDLFVTDNQGNFNPFNELNHVMAGADYGFRNAIERKQSALAPPLTEPAIDIPHPWTRSVNGICFLTTPSNAPTQGWGAFEGHLVGCEYDTRRLIRMSLQKVGETYQGAAYPLSRYQVEGPTLLGPITCAMAPNGDLYVGCIRDSGWGGANNIGGIVRIRPGDEPLPAGIAEVRVLGRGFEIEFTRGVRAELATDLANYHVASYRRVSTPDYGGPDLERRSEKIVAATLSEDARTVSLEFEELREGFVYEFHLRNLAGGNATFFPAEAHYTLRRRP